VPEFSPETMETNVPGLYVAGTAAGGTQTQYKLFIETSHVDVEKIAAAIGARSRREA
jgi:thioredoxin reductase (NADPH)